MKIHAFVRSTASRAQFPQFRHFLYFLFAPTLIYQDQYPRTPKIDRKFALCRLLECILLVFTASFTVSYYVAPRIENFGLQRFKLKQVILILFENVFVGSLLFFCTFFFFLHSWHNLCAELTRFADRRFYGDWWNSCSYLEYFRKWNYIVYDWLHLYLYVDLKACFDASSAKFAVFFISAAVHEWLWTVLFGIFLPLEFFEYMLFGGFLFYKMPKNAFSNWVVVFGLSLGAASLVTFYGMEFYAKINAPHVGNAFLPRIFSHVDLQ